MTGRRPTLPAASQRDGRRRFYTEMCRLFVCRRCGRLGINTSIHLDHVDPSAKRFLVSDFFHRRSMHTWMEVAEEMAKCQPLCRDCHLRSLPVDYGQLALFEEIA